MYADIHKREMGMSLGVLAVIILVIINTALMIGVMYFGAKHDAHTPQSVV